MIKDLHVTLSATVVARPNIALVKYWGKADRARNLPMTGSLLVTLDGFTTHTTVTRCPDLAVDEMSLDGQQVSSLVLARTMEFVDLVRAGAGIRDRVRIITENNFPTASGLASSASGFAALTLALSRVFDLPTDPRIVAALARRGSGSAPRSLLGGVVLYRPDEGDGSEDSLVQLCSADAWDLRMVVAVTSDEAKAVGSSEGMEHTRTTSPYFSAWVEHNRGLLEEGRRAVDARDLEALGEVAEASCFAMHASMLASRPPLLYWNPATVGAISAVRELRAAGIGAWATIDAGPHVKVLCGGDDAAAVAARLAEVEGVREVREERPGAGAELEG